MEALNAASLTPVSVLSGRKKNSRKILSLPSNPQLKFTETTTSNGTSTNMSEVLSRSLNGGLMVLSSVLSNGVARALTYEEALQQSVTSITSEGGSDFDIGGLLDGVVAFGTENAAFLIGGAALIGVPLVLSKVLKKDPKAWGVETAKNAYAKLAEDGSAQLLDIRTLADSREMGSPDIRGLKKKAVSIVYKGEDKPGFLKKLGLKFKDPENTTLFILDKFDGNSELVAELATVNGFKAAYAIKDGAEGTRGWMNSGLPWIQPKKSLSLDFSSLTEAFGGALDGGSDALSVSLGLAAATGLGLLAFTEIETVLQLLGSAALFQFVSKKLLFAEDRKETLKVVDEFLTTKIAPKELVGEIKQIGLALLPISIDKKALPAPTDVPETPVLKAEDVPEPKVETAVEPTPATNSVPETPVLKAEDVPEPKVETAVEPTPATNSVPETPVVKAEDVPAAEPEPKVEAAVEPTPATNSVPETPVLKAEAVPAAEPEPKVEAAVEPTPATNSVPETPVLKAEAVPAAEPEPKVEAAVEPTPATNSVPKAEAKVDSHPGSSRPQSPYAYYEDLKPPTSPMPSQP